jgi:putative ABC transport system permease protein
LKAIKYIISFCIIFVGMLIIGESHIFYLDNFYTRFDYTTMYLQSGTTDEEMIQLRDSPAPF